MGVLCDRQIREMSIGRSTESGFSAPGRPIISPYVRMGECPFGTISWGESSGGYDISLDTHYKIFRRKYLWFGWAYRLASWLTGGRWPTGWTKDGVIVDPKCFRHECFVDHDGPYCLIPPNSFVLASSVEYVRVPRDCIAIVLGKSTYARCGITANFTPLEPGWEGRITIELGNLTPLPAKVYSNEGIAQVLFFKLDQSCDMSYDEKPGKKYQGQLGLTLPRHNAS